MKPHKHTIRLSATEVGKLQNIIRKGKHHAREGLRARILLMSHRGVGKDVVATRCETNRSTVQRIRDHYRNNGLERALCDAPRSGAPKKITEKVEAHLVAIACSAPPEGYDSWTLEMLQGELIATKKLTSISTVAIWQHLHNRGIKPWRGKNVVRPLAHA